ncbi:MAG: preprotein translocase subunit SecE [Candidatus Dependentiae bacterium]|nr:preprotein translocase subunit SecE [Candidatus Dependentiae bacterium]
MQFLHEVRAELLKVVWPKFDEFQGSTIVVLLLVCAFAIYFFVIDLGLSQLAQYVLRLYGAY